MSKRKAKTPSVDGAVPPIRANPPLAPVRGGGSTRAVMFLQRQLIAAETDEQAIEAWLLQCSSPATAANYRKEADRFLMWIKARGRDLRTLVVEDLAAYSSFLSRLDKLTPEDAEQWISSRRWPKTDIRWRPFQGPLSKASQRQALVAIGAMLRWLEKTGYVDRSPATLMKIAKVRKRKVDRYLPWEAIGHLLNAADRLPEKNTEQRLYKIRMRFLVCLFSLTGARLSDLPSATMASIHRNPDGLWWWSVTGKGDKDEEVPVPRDLLTEFMKYRASMRMPELPTADDDSPLVPSLRGGGPAAESTIYVALKKLFKQAAFLARESDPDLGDRLDVASPHWLRHTALTHQADMKMDLRWIQANARHEDINTTMGYLHQDDRDRHRETDRVMKLDSVQEK
ncbi:tyrosine-type recombinase/integrase [Sulfuricystis multivorans]|uniref:tyrosine-type recombinase/integrase n=1 Tax=Sulfuricystis multivorans TaxID=2211108 RepID=UPI000F81DDEA|nr:tyrosine-type recombinase/integrase [Sulfuricystis multivorans]